MARDGFWSRMGTRGGLRLGARRRYGRRRRRYDYDEDDEQQREQQRAQRRAEEIKYLSRHRRRAAEAQRRHELEVQERAARKKREAGTEEFERKYIERGGTDIPGLRRALRRRGEREETPGAYAARTGWRSREQRADILRQRARQAAQRGPITGGKRISLGSFGPQAAAAGRQFGVENIAVDPRLRTEAEKQAYAAAIAATRREMAATPLPRQLTVAEQYEAENRAAGLAGASRTMAGETPEAMTEFYRGKGYLARPGESEMQRRERESGIGFRGLERMFAESGAGTPEEAAEARWHAAGYGLGRPPEAAESGLTPQEQAILEAARAGQPMPQGFAGEVRPELVRRLMAEQPPVPVEAMAPAAEGTPPISGAEVDLQEWHPVRPWPALPGEPRLDTRFIAPPTVPVGSEIALRRRFSSTGEPLDEYGLTEADLRTQAALLARPAYQPPERPLQLPITQEQGREAERFGVAPEDVRRWETPVSGQELTRQAGLLEYGGASPRETMLALRRRFGPQMGDWLTEQQQAHEQRIAGMLERAGGVAAQPFKFPRVPGELATEELARRGMGLRGEQIRGELAETEAARRQRAAEAERGRGFKREMLPHEKEQAELERQLKRDVARITMGGRAREDLMKEGAIAGAAAYGIASAYVSQGVGDLNTIRTDIGLLPEEVQPYAIAALRAKLPELLSVPEGQEVTLDRQRRAVEVTRMVGELSQAPPSAAAGPGPGVAPTAPTAPGAPPTGETTQQLHSRVANEPGLRAIVDRVARGRAQAFWPTRLSGFVTEVADDPAIEGWLSQAIRGLARVIPLEQIPARVGDMAWYALRHSPEWSVQEEGEPGKFQPIWGKGALSMRMLGRANLETAAGEVKEAMARKALDLVEKLRPQLEYLRPTGR